MSGFAVPSLCEKELGILRDSPYRRARRFHGVPPDARNKFAGARFFSHFHFTEFTILSVTVSMMALGLRWLWIAESDHGWLTLVAIHLLVRQR